MHEARSPILTGRFCSLDVLPHSSLYCCRVCSEVFGVKSPSTVAVGEAVLECVADMLCRFTGCDPDGNGSADVDDLVSSLVLLFD